MKGLEPLLSYRATPASALTSLEGSAIASGQTYRVRAPRADSGSSEAAPPIASARPLANDTTRPLSRASTIEPVAVPILPRTSNDEFRQLASEKHLKFEVDFAENGEEAVGLTGTREYTCVFLDVVLPGIDGYQVCKLIKANKQAIKKTAVVMLTSRSSPFDKLRGSLAGCDEYLTKPLDEDRLLEVIAQFLPSSRRRERSGSK